MQDEQIDIRNLTLSSEYKFKIILSRKINEMKKSFIRAPAVTTVDGLPPDLSMLLVVLGVFWGVLRGVFSRKSRTVVSRDDSHPGTQSNED